MKIVRGCPECAAQWRGADARFCGRCGARLIDADPTTRGAGRSDRVVAVLQGTIRVTAVVAALATVTGLFVWASGRPASITEVDIGVPPAAELQSPPAPPTRAPRCEVDGLERDCVVWGHDTLITSGRLYGSLVVVVTRDHVIRAIDPATGDTVWEVHDAAPPGSLLLDFGNSSRIILQSEGEVLMLDVATGQVITRIDGWIQHIEDNRAVVVPAERPASPYTMFDSAVLDLASGRVVGSISMASMEYTVHLGPPLVVIRWEVSAEPSPHDGRSRTVVRAHDGTELWTGSDGLEAVAADDELVYLVSQGSEGDADVQARTLTSGDIVWEAAVSYPSGAVLTAGLLVIGTLEEGVIAFDAGTGTRQWVSHEEQANVVYHGDLRRLTDFDVPGDVVLVQWSRTGDSQLLGLDAETGETVWRSPSVGDFWWESSRITRDGVVTIAENDITVTPYDETPRRTFGIETRVREEQARVLSLDPLVVYTGYEILGIDRSVALPRRD